MRPRIADSNVALDLPREAPLLEALHEVVLVGRVQVQGSPRLQGAMDGAEDLQEVVGQRRPIKEAACGS